MKREEWKLYKLKQKKGKAPENHVHCTARTAEHGEKPRFSSFVGWVEERNPTFEFVGFRSSAPTCKTTRISMKKTLYLVNSSSYSACKIFCTAFFILLLPACLIADTYCINGLSSNVVSANGKVYFVQADETFTVLDLKTGDVLERRVDWIWRFWKLYVIPEGLLA